MPFYSWHSFFLRYHFEWPEKRLQSFAIKQKFKIKIVKQIYFLHYKIFQNSLIEAIRFQTSWCSNGSQSQWKNGRNRTSEVQRKIWEGMEWFPCSAKHQLQDNWLPTVFWLSQESQEIQSLIHMCRIQQAEFIPLHKAWEQAPAVAKSTHHCTYMAKLLSGIKSKRLVWRDQKKGKPECSYKFYYIWRL